MASTNRQDDQLCPCLRPAKFQPFLSDFEVNCTKRTKCKLHRA